MAYIQNDLIKYTFPLYISSLTNKMFVCIGAYIYLRKTFQCWKKKKQKYYETYQTRKANNFFKFYIYTVSVHCTLESTRVSIAVYERVQDKNMAWLL